jgi:hypothetical protein
MLLFTNSKFCKLLLPNKKSLVWVLSLIFVLSSGIQTLGQMASPNTFVEFPFPTKVYSKNSAFRWVYPTVTGSPINDIGHSFAVGESGHIIKLGTIDLNESFFFNFIRESGYIFGMSNTQSSKIYFFKLIG